MSIRIRHLVLYLLLACLPLQSVAGPAHVLLCDEATQVAAGGSHVHDGGAEHPAHDAPASPGGGFSHDCYQHYFSGVVHGVSPVAGASGPVYGPIGLASFYSFFPERLKRPPLAVLTV